MNIDKEQLLKYTYLIGGLYDLILGFTLVIGLTFTGKTLSNLFDVALPQPLLFGQVSGLFLIAVGYYLLVASKKPTNFMFIAMGSVFVRLSYGMIILLSISTVHPLYIILGITDTLTGFLLLFSIIWYQSTAY